MRGLSRFQVGLKTNRTQRSGHPKTRMRRLVKLGSIFVGVLLLLMITGLGGAIANKLVFYGHVVRLYTLEPESKISMPLEDVAKRQITDTWHAPRGTDRLHEGQDIFAAKGTPVLSATRGFVYNIGENNLGGQ